MESQRNFIYNFLHLGSSWLRSYGGWIYNYSAYHY